MVCSPGMGALEEGEPLALLRVGSWRFSVPLRRVARVMGAAMPVGIPEPASQDGLSSAVRVQDRLVPVVYAALLFGAKDVELRMDQKMVLLSTSQGDLLLWVDAIEDILPFAPLPAPSQDAVGWAEGFCGGELAHAVLDVERLREL